MSQRDFYEVLGLKRDASAEDIKRAYRRLAHAHHPDKAGGNEEKFKEMNEAYQTLSNEDKRRQYDQFGRTFEGGGQGAGGFSGFDFGGQNPFEGFDFGNFSSQGGNFAGFDFSDIFSEFAGGTRAQSARRRKGQDILVDLEVSLEDLYENRSREIGFRTLVECASCKGVGHESGTRLIKCDACGGSGRTQEVKRTILGAISVQRPCATCQGRGEKPEKVCRECDGEGRVKDERRVGLEVPPYIKDGETFAVRGAGEAAGRNGVAGDLLVRVHVKPHKVFKRAGPDVLNEVKVPFLDMVLGAELEVPTLGGARKLRIPKGTQSGERLKLEGLGFKNASGRHGDQIITVQVEVPRRLSKKAENLLSELKEEL